VFLIYSVNIMNNRFAKQKSRSINNNPYGPKRTPNNLTRRRLFNANSNNTTNPSSCRSKLKYVAIVKILLVSVYLLFQSSSASTSTSTSIVAEVEDLSHLPAAVAGVVIDQTEEASSSSSLVKQDPPKSSEGIKSDIFSYEDTGTGGKSNNVDADTSGSETVKVKAKVVVEDDESAEDGEGEGDNKSAEAEAEEKHDSEEEPDKVEKAADSALSASATSSEGKLDKCSFRKYKPNRYYPVNETSESFLSDSEYIRGKLPFIINPRNDSDSDNKTGPTKICIDTSEWETVDDDHRPFSDGQNPSFVSLAHDAYNLHDDHHTPRIEKSTIQPLEEIYGSDEIDNMFLGLLLFGDSQCRWNMSAKVMEEYHFSPLLEAPQKRSMVLILNGSMEPVGQAVLQLELDKTWGEKRKRHNKKKKENGEGYERIIVELDDARLFFHNGKLHVLYRNGPSFGYDKQLQNPIHITKVGEDKFEAYIKSSETFSVCCGRNIAFISETPANKGSGGSGSDLLALTWIDPVTTNVVDHPMAAVDVDVTDTKRRLQEIIWPTSTSASTNENGRRRLGQKLKKSSIHGTNGYMSPLHSTSELLGIAHFHRPEHRDSSEFAKHGHHYTHAFFTLQIKTVGEGDDEKEKYILKRLSNEFAFMAPSSSDDNTADVIQFASGVDLVGSDKDGKLMISYGINDCEGAIIFLGMEQVQNFLIPVEDGDEVVNLMGRAI